jgi:hypothetical protein
MKHAEDKFWGMALLAVIFLIANGLWYLAKWLFSPH